MSPVSETYEADGATVHTAPGGGCVVCGGSTGRGVHNVDGSGNVTIMAVCDSPEHADMLGLGSSNEGLVDIPE